MSGLPQPIVLAAGSMALCREYSLVLESKAIEHDLRETGEEWVLTTDAAFLDIARYELDRYKCERLVRRPIVQFAQPFAGASLAACAYAVVLLITAYAAGIDLFGKDWLAAGALDATGFSRHEWARAITALTLHADQQHLLGNVLCGMLVGTAAARLVGPGIAWILALVAAGFANLVEMAVSPPAHRAIGASTAVFAMLGLISGLAWAETRQLRERHWYRWAPVIAGACLLALFGAGSPEPAAAMRSVQIDVLGHVLGFCCGVGVGWGYAQTSLLQSRSRLVQSVAGLSVLLTVGCAWLAALTR